MNVWLDFAKNVLKLVLFGSTHERSTSCNVRISVDFTRPILRDVHMIRLRLRFISHEYEWHFVLLSQTHHVNTYIKSYATHLL